MSHSENISKLILEYDHILLKDLGFKDWETWEPMITKIIDTLGVNSLHGMCFGDQTKSPGEKISLFLIQKWASGKGKYWKDLVYIDKQSYSTPYGDYIEYTIKIKSKRDLLGELSGFDVYQNYDLLKNIFDSHDYKILSKLRGTKVTIV